MPKSAKMEDFVENFQMGGGDICDPKNYIAIFFCIEDTFDSKTVPKGGNVDVPKNSTSGVGFHNWDFWILSVLTILDEFSEYVATKGTYTNVKMGT